MRSEAPVKSFEDVFKREVIVGATNEGGTTRDMPSLLNNVLGARFRIVTGYAGTNEITLALERNEVDGICGFGWTSINASYPHWLERGVVRILGQENAKGHPDLNKKGTSPSIEVTLATGVRTCRTFSLWKFYAASLLATCRSSAVNSL